jgi:tRNA (cmo5U34)-methyltransferase
MRLLPKDRRSARIRSGFNLLAPWYDFVATVFLGGAIMRTQRHFLPKLGSHGSVLILGGGTGRILADMLKLGMGKKYIYVDISEKMISAAQQRVMRLKIPVPQIEFICGSVDAIAGKKFSLVVTPFVLDCLDETEIGAAMQKLNAALAPGGKWLFADFHVPSGLMGFISRAVVRALYFAFNVLCGLGIRKLPEFNRHFQQLGLSYAAEQVFLGGMLITRVYDKKASK